jgi:hypothetical protein
MVSGGYIDVVVCSASRPRGINRYDDYLAVCRSGR